MVVLYEYLFYALLKIRIPPVYRRMYRRCINKRLHNFHELLSSSRRVWFLGFEQFCGLFRRFVYSGRL